MFDRKPQISIKRSHRISVCHHVVRPGPCPLGAGKTLPQPGRVCHCLITGPPSVQALLHCTSPSPTQHPVAGTVSFTRFQPPLTQLSTVNNCNTTTNAAIYVTINCSITTYPASITSSNATLWPSRVPVRNHKLQRHDSFGIHQVVINCNITTHLRSIISSPTETSDLLGVQYVITSCKIMTHPVSIPSSSPETTRLTRIPLRHHQLQHHDPSGL